VPTITVGGMVATGGGWAIGADDGGYLGHRTPAFPQGGCAQEQRRRVRWGRDAGGICLENDFTSQRKFVVLTSQNYGMDAAAGEFGADTVVPPAELLGWSDNNGAPLKSGGSGPISGREWRFPEGDSTEHSKAGKNL